METKAMIYVPECNVDVFKTDADSHGVEIELLEVDYFDNYIFDAEGDALNDNEWIEYLEANGIEVSVFSEILEEVRLCGTTKSEQSHTRRRKHLRELRTTLKR